MILGIETSCDETAAAVVQGRRVLSNVVRSQVRQHAPYGGVVPEIAARAHLEWLPAVITRALDAAALPGFEALEAVAVTRGPGLAGALLVGYATALGLSLRLGCPLIGVNHIEAHLFSALLSPEGDCPQECFPALSLVVSGGHTLLYRVQSLERYVLVGRTLDDAAGEAFDKGAALLGLDYPGGPAIARLAEGAAIGRIRFPRARPRPDNPLLSGLRSAYCWSFSGLKTALRVYLERHPDPDVETQAAIAADYQEAIVDALVGVCDRSLQGERCLFVGGGVALNRRLQSKLRDWAHARGVSLRLTPTAYCGDNAAMIAAVAALGKGIRGTSLDRLEIQPNLFASERGVSCG